MFARTPRVAIQHIFALAISVALVVSALPASAIAEPAQVGIQSRVAWTTSRITGAPEPPRPYTTEPAFPALKFTACLDLASAPGSDRLFVVEQAGKIFSFPNRDDVQSHDLVVDLANEIDGVEQVYALAFHPNFERNRYCYVCYIKAANQPNGTHIARFRIADTEPPTLDVASETTILTFLSGGHNGCCLKFGPDSYLYISTGDGGPANPPDTLRTGQDLGDLLSSILRIDVDQAEGGRNYRIPVDNPFVDVPNARGEIWAYGLRNPWRMSFDRKTGDLWVGDVGWELWEMLNRIERGGNYGWAVTEGRQSVNPEWPRGPTPILPPTVDHPHSESSSITDGLTYYGSRLGELHGHHIYSDYDTGKVWGFRFEGGRVVDHQELADTTLRVVGFGEDQDGEFYLIDHAAGALHRLIPNPRPAQSTEFPRRLSDSGLFASVAEHTLAPGVVPYSINAEPWADYAVAERLVGVPNELSIKSEGALWTFPENCVLAKTLSLDMEHGNPASRRRIETQILHFDGIDWQPYTYEWNAEQSDAVLLDADGAERTFNVTDAAAPGGKRQQTWRFSGRGECQRCHNRWSGPVLAFNSPQLNRAHNYGGVLAPQLATLTHIRLLESSAGSQAVPGIANPHDPSAAINDRARAYLHANCAHCHRMHAGGSVLAQMQFELPLEQTNMVGVRPTQGTFGIHAAQVIAAGDPFRSVLWYRMAKLGAGRMPHLGSTEIDRAGVELIHDWVRQLPAETGAAPTDSAAARLRDENERDIERLRAVDIPADRDEIVRRLLSSTSGALRLVHSIDSNTLPAPVVKLAIEHGTQHADVCIRDLFERFLPAEKRIKHLGSVVRPEQILALAGDAVRGKQVFETPGVSCQNCHRVHLNGADVGPELTAIGGKLTREQLLESILEPSRRVDPKYVTYLAETGDGRLITGLLISRDAHVVVLKDAHNKAIRIPLQDIQQLVPQQQSLMPDLLLRDVTAQQAADLLAYLSSLK